MSWGVEKARLIIILVLPLLYIIIPGGRSSSRPSRFTIYSSSSARISALTWSPPYSRWWRLKSPR